MVPAITPSFLSLLTPGSLSSHARAACGRRPWDHCHSLAVPWAPTHPAVRATMMDGMGRRSPAGKEYGEDEYESSFTKGEAGSVSGVHLPFVTKAEKQYLSEAKTNKEYLRRLREIGTRYTNERVRINQERHVQTSENYMNSLSQSRVNAPKANAPESPNGTLSGQLPAEQEKEHISREASGFDAYLRAQEASKNVRDRALPSLQSEGDALRLSSVSIDDEIAELEGKMSELMAGESAADISDPETVTPNENSSRNEERDEDPDVLQKKIDFLESYIQKIKQEYSIHLDGHNPGGDGRSVTEQKSNPISQQFSDTIRQLEAHVAPMGKASDGAQGHGMSNSSKDVDTRSAQGLGRDRKDPGNVDQLKISGLENTPGEISAEEKRLAFEALRQQAFSQRGQSDLYDPLARPLENRGSEISDALQSSELGSSKASDSLDDDSFSYDMDFEKRMEDVKEFRRLAMESASKQDETFTEETSGQGSAENNAAEKHERTNRSMGESDGRENNAELAIVEINFELDRYMTEARNVLERHEQHLRTIIQRYMPDL